jgi:lipopolysaccharide/colanic/teichoic acid biosynthesis glycosyltransferase
MHDEVLRQKDVVDDGFSSILAQFRNKIRPRAKRMIDMLAASALIIVVLPMALLIMLAIVLNGQTPFYSHVRVGQGGRKFRCLKFRSMRRNADSALAGLLQRDPAAKLEWETTRKLRNDPRVTRVGRILRATSLDELPQLINVIVGQMSLVGPRPVTQDELEQFYGAPEQAAYNSVRPGLTGLWQVNGRSEASFANRVALDTLYVQRLSLRTDLLILIQTIPVAVSRRGAWSALLILAEMRFI